MLDEGKKKRHRGGHRQHSAQMELQRAVTIAPVVFHANRRTDEHTDRKRHVHREVHVRRVEKPAVGSSDDLVEGAAAFFEGRPPEFQGR